ncbi:MAG: isoprenyl transferase [Alphaproteobacteria bacterium]|nr:isoprenyl transferase [Alphaproteobacteria bacterium]
MDALPATEGGAPPPPTHIAVIMDGNGRWAESRGLPRIAGHKKGAEAVRRTLKAAARMGVSYLTLFGFSSENWNRPEGEVGDLMGLLRLYLQSEIDALNSNGVRLRVIGDRSRFDPDIIKLIDRAESETAGNSRITLVLALSYGGRQEIVRAARDLARQAAAGAVDPDAIDETTFAGALETAGIPDPDLLIRTSGEQRVSNFLLWQLAYTELVFTDVQWPDFCETELAAAIETYNRRERRYGASVGSR